jgi:hypothetical protein
MGWCALIVNWAHVLAIRERPGFVSIYWNKEDSKSPDFTAVNPKDITVVGEGSMKVNQWLAEVAEKAEETE